MYPSRYILMVRSQSSVMLWVQPRFFRISVLIMKTLPVIIFMAPKNSWATLSIM